MAYYYVKNSLGTRTTGGGLTKQTGSFAALGAASVYATIEAAITDGAGAADFICVSDAHQYTKGAGIVYAGPDFSPGVSASSGTLVIISVDDLNCDTYAKATAFQEAVSTSDIELRYRLLLIGVWFKSYQNFAGENDKTTVYARDCTFEIANTGFGVVMYLRSAAGADYFFDRCTFTVPVPDAFCYLFSTGNNRVRCFKCDTNNDGYIAQVAQGFDGAHFECVGCDWSTCALGHLADINGYSPYKILYQGCKLNDAITEDLYFGSTYEPFMPGGEMKLVNCYLASTPADAPWQYFFRNSEGKLTSNDTIYRDETKALAGQKISYKVVTRSTPYFDRGFTFRMPYRRVDLTTTDTVRIYLASTAALTDQDVIVRVIYADGTNSEVLNIADNLTVFGLDVASNLTSDVGSIWKDTGGATDLTGYNEYYIDIDTSGDAGGDCIPLVEVTIGKASTTIYIDPILEGV